MSGVFPNDARIDPSAEGTNTNTISTNLLSSPDNNEVELSKEEKMRKWRIEYALHMIIPIYGAAVLVMVLGTYLK